MLASSMRATSPYSVLELKATAKQTGWGWSDCGSKAPARERPESLDLARPRKDVARHTRSTSDHLL